MSLIKKYSNHSLSELVSILESGDDYTKEAKVAVHTILELKNIPEEDLKKNALEYWTKKIKEDIKSYLLNNEIPKSTFLSFDEIKSLMLEAFEKYKEDKELFEIDTTKYWFIV